MICSRHIALLYALYATLAVLLLASAMPPMQNNDEGFHTYRADQVSHFGLLGQRFAFGFGGNVDSGLLAIKAITTKMIFHPEVKVSRSMYAPVGWGTPVPAGFPNTAVYPPFFYLPAAAMAAIARHMSIPLPHALVLMRLAMGATSIAIGALAIALAGNAAIWLFAILLLPMSMALSAAVTQDGPMLACTSLAVALSLRLRNPLAPWRRTTFVAMCLLLAMVGMARPPYAAFALILLAAPMRRWVRLTGLVATLACVLVWSALNASDVALPPAIWVGGPVDPAAQFWNLLAHPQRVASLAMATWRASGSFLRESFIGVLGWLDCRLPQSYHDVAWAGLALALISTVFAGAGPGRPRDAALAVLAMLGACFGIGLIQYLTWTASGASAIEGIQGRYFLAPSLLLGIVLSRARMSSWPVSRWLAVPVLALPIASIAVTLHAVLIRYYF